MNQPHDAQTAQHVDGEVRIAGSDDDPVGQQLHAVFRNQGLALRDCAQLAREHAHERRRQMLGDEDRNADLFRQTLEQGAKRMDAARAVFKSRDAGALR